MTSTPLEFAAFERFARELGDSHPDQTPPVDATAAYEAFESMSEGDKSALSLAHGLNVLGEKLPSDLAASRLGIEKSTYRYRVRNANKAFLGLLYPELNDLTETTDT